MVKRLLIALPLLAGVLAAVPALAEPQPFTAPAFAAAKAKGGPILVEITAPWCPTCAKQRPILSSLESSPEFQNLTVFAVDFDSQKDAVRDLGARMQSTLIVFHGATETGRSVGSTDPKAIHDLLATGEHG